MTRGLLKVGKICNTVIFSLTLSFMVSEYCEEKIMDKWFLYIGRLEGLSFLILLGIAMPLKYYWHLPAMVRLVGSFHGALFLAYLALAFLLSSRDEWKMSKIFLAVIASVIPFGTFWFERRYLFAH